MGIHIDFNKAPDIKVELGCKNNNKNQEMMQL